MQAKEQQQVLTVLEIKMLDKQKKIYEHWQRNELYELNFVSKMKQDQLMKVCLSGKLKKLGLIK